MGIFFGNSYMQAVYEKIFKSQVGFKFCKNLITYFPQKCSTILFSILFLSIPSASSGSNFPELIELVKRYFPLKCTEMLSSFPSCFSSIWKRYSSSLARTLVTLRRANTAFARNFPSSRSACLRYFWISSFPETRSTHMAHAQLDFSPFLRSWIISSTTTFGIFFPPQTVSRML